jgi:uncharacterized integral membrane protein
MHGMLFNMESSDIMMARQISPQRTGISIALIGGILFGTALANHSVAELNLFIIIVVDLVLFLLTDVVSTKYIKSQGVVKVILFVLLALNTWIVRLIILNVS